MGSVPALEELAALMRDKSLNFDGEILNVIYSTDGTRRFVLLKTEKGFVTYVYEQLFPLDEEELKFSAINGLPAYWHPCNSQYGSVFDTEETALKELYSEPEYKAHFVK